MAVADVVIIGGGIAGASLGYRLASRCKVVILEAEDQPGYHSTGRSAALFTATYGHPVIRALTVASRDFLSQPAGEFAQTEMMSPRGALWIARQDQRATLETFLAEVTPLDPSVAACSPEDAAALCPVLGRDYVAAAASEPHACDIDVASLHQGYLNGFRRRGGQVVTGARVGEIRRNGKTWEICASTGAWSTRTVVNAAGAWADEIAAMAGARPIGLTPKRRTAITFDPPRDVDPRAWPCVLDVDETFYFKPDAGRILASPADETPTAPSDAQPEELDIAVTVDRIETATTLQVRRIASRWAGLRSFVADKVPVVGPAPDAEGFFWLAGQGGYGIMTSPALSDVAAALLLGEALPQQIADLGVRTWDLSAERLQASGLRQPV
ncbi:MAG TPA: FAD-binding oxidoreductase [Phenylobacterium sp.]|uniref:NAD(P)/FAD-dependent oxidoreductase n=1 Tax=Phenylobacterium sp. TaxID=1871053 RepID=UPI002D6462F4|nr:FAD-binding oxidoreductase [Phenylobacterium sp.]HZZ69767.1 FAD-binding oxidoreductase [Phenylobacterium sp.]